MDKNTKKVSVKKHTKKIRGRIWMILLSSLLPFLFLVMAFVIQADTANEKLMTVAVFLFACGVAFLAAKLASYTIIERYLNLIERLDDAKSDFISIASHQLKSPVSSLKYTMDVFMDALEKQDWDTVEEFSGDIKSSVQRLDSLTHKLLDVARAEAGRLEGEPETFTLLNRLDEIISELEPLARKKSISLSTAYEVGEAAVVRVDPSFFYNVVDNLLTNALDYAPTETTVLVKVEKVDSMAKIMVSNVAESVTPSDFNKIFDKFSRGNENKQGETVGGTGLGLFIAKSYVESWGGSINVHLSDIDSKQRAIFTFTVPL